MGHVPATPRPFFSPCHHFEFLPRGCKTKNGRGHFILPRARVRIGYEIQLVVVAVVLYLKKEKRGFVGDVGGGVLYKRVIAFSSSSLLLLSSLTRLQFLLGGAKLHLEKTGWNKPVNSVRK